MSLNVALNYAVSGLTVSQAQLQVLSGNISNAQTPGYTEEQLAQTSDPSTNGGAGVVTGAVQRATDVALQKTILGQTTISGGASALDSYQQQIQTLIGQVGTGSAIGNALNNFTSALQSLSTTPQDPVAQSTAVDAGQQLAQQLNDLSTGIQTVRQGADTQIATDVGTLNTAITTIGQLNAQINQLQAQGQPTVTLADQRDQALAKIANLVGVQSFVQPDGSMTVMTTQGQALVEDTTVNLYGYTPSGTVTATTALSPLTLDGADVTAQTTTGEIGSLLQMRDTTLPGLTTQLNEFTNNLFNLTTTPALGTTNSGLGATNDANHFFAAVDTGAGVDNAATILVNPDLVANPGLLDSNAGSPDPSISATLSSNLDGTAAFAAAGGIPATTTTLSSYSAQMIGAASTAAANATSTASDQSALLTQMQSQYSSATGVNLDNELSQLVVFQNAYSASARVISTIQTMYDALMNA